jgi:hypothetical protein
MMARKRGNGEGSIYPVKDKSGRVTGYRGSYWVHTKSGPKRRYLRQKERGRSQQASEGARESGRRPRVRRRHLDGR